MGKEHLFIGRELSLSSAAAVSVQALTDFLPGLLQYMPNWFSFLYSVFFDYIFDSDAQMTF